MPPDHWLACLQGIKRPWIPLGNQQLGTLMALKPCL